MCYSGTTLNWIIKRCTFASQLNLEGFIGIFILKLTINQLEIKMGSFYFTLLTYVGPFEVCFGCFEQEYLRLSGCTYIYYYKKHCNKVKKLERTNAKSVESNVFLVFVPK